MKSIQEYDAILEAKDAEIKLLRRQLEDNWNPYRKAAEVFHRDLLGMIGLIKRYGLERKLGKGYYSDDSLYYQSHPPRPSSRDRTK